MRYRALKGTNLALSELGFGCSSYWAKPQFPDKEAVALLHRAADKGINFFDTGYSYADGNAELRLGRFLKERGSGELIVSTKVGTVKARRGQATKDFSSENITSSLEASLKRLGLEQLPILFLHGPSLGDLTDDVYDVLQRLKESGKVAFTGLHNSNIETIRHGLAAGPFDVFLSDYNILRQDMAPVIDAIADAGKGFIAATPLAQMLFSKRIFRFSGKQDIWYLLRALAKHRGNLFAARRFQFMEEQQYPATAIALNFVLENQNVTCAVFGTTRRENLDTNVSSLAIDIPQGILQRIRAA